MKSDIDLWLIIITSWITIGVFCWQCINFPTEEAIQKEREMKKQMELQKRK